MILHTPSHCYLWLPVWLKPVGLGDVSVFFRRHLNSATGRLCTNKDTEPGVNAHVGQIDKENHPEDDLHSCGVLSLNALAHHYSTVTGEKTTPLILADRKGAIALERMRLAHRALSIHYPYVSKGD